MSIFFQVGLWEFGLSIDLYPYRFWSLDCDLFRVRNPIGCHPSTDAILDTQFGPVGMCFHAARYGGVVNMPTPKVCLMGG